MLTTQAGQRWPQGLDPTGLQDHLLRLSFAQIHLEPPEETLLGDDPHKGCLDSDASSIQMV